MTTLTRDAKDSGLMIDGVKVATLARKFGTPLYVYSHACLTDNFKRIRQAFAPVNPIVAYAMKSNSNGAILRALVREGAGMDIVSGGELHRALAAGVDPKKVIFAGVGKTREEIADALRAGILAFNVESEPEALAIAEVARKMKRRAPICIRVNPDVDAATHHYITTGRKDNKFGIAFHTVRRLIKRLAALPGLDVVGLHSHIGSQITKPDGYIKMVGRMGELVTQLRKDGHDIRIINLGGGFGIAYEETEKPMDIAALARAMIPAIQELGTQIIFEPGRSVSGPAGFLLTRLEYVKITETKNFAIVDGAMNDLIRPSLYSAYHRILLDGPVRRGRRMVYDVVGPICESGDFLGKERTFPTLAPDDLLVVCDAGAYGMAMSSNYNSRPRPAEVLIRDGKAHLIRQRESLAEVIGPEVVPSFLATKK